MLNDSTTYRVSRMKTLIALDPKANPHTKTTYNPHTTGSHHQEAAGRSPKASVKTMSSATWISRWTPLDSTAATVTTSRGIGTRFTSGALSIIAVVPVSQALVKKL